MFGRRIVNLSINNVIGALRHACDRRAQFLLYISNDYFKYLIKHIPAMPGGNEVVSPDRRVLIANLHKYYINGPQKNIFARVKAGHIHDDGVAALMHINDLIEVKNGMEISQRVTVNGCILDEVALNLASKPVRVAMSAKSYETLTCFWDLGLISDDCFEAWHDLCFAGFTPDKLVVRQSQRGSFWAKHLGLKTDFVPQIPCYRLSSEVFYPIVEKGDGYFTSDKQLAMADVSFSTHAHPMESTISQLMDGSMGWHAGYKILSPWRGQHSKLLRDRQRVGLDTAVQMLQMIPALNENKATIARWLACCLFRSPESFNSWVMLLNVHRDFEILVVWMVAHNWHPLGMKDFSKAAKKLHALVRRCRVLPPGLKLSNIDNALYLNLTNGRYAAAADPDLESLGLRTQAERPLPKSAYDTPNHKAEMYSAIERGVASSMAKFAESFPTGTDLLTKHRQEFYHLGASGSVDARIRNQYLSHIPMGDMDKNGLTKTVALNELTRNQMGSILTSDGPVQATLVWKFEADKQRMMLPGQFDHWSQENTLLGLGEATYFARDKTIALQMSSIQEASDIIRRWSEIVRDEVILDADYADFNIAHMRRIMQLLWLSLGRVLPPDLMVIPDKLSVPDLCRLLAHRLDKMLVKLGGVAATAKQLKEFPQLKQKVLECQFGLYTGWRSTMFINTTLNKIYYDAAVATTFSGGGYKDVRRVGDDAHVVLHSIYGGLRQLCALNDADLELNGSKQVLGVGKSELVRVTSTVEGISASVVRAVSGCISSDLQSPVCARGIGAPRSVYDGIANVLRRCPDGGHKHRWWTSMLHNWSKVWVRDPKFITKRKLMHIPRTLIHSSTTTGGLGLWLPGDPWYESTSNVPHRDTVVRPTTHDQRKALCAGEAGSFIARQVVGIKAANLTSIIDGAIIGKFISLDHRDVLNIQRDVDMQDWLLRADRAKYNPAQAPCAQMISSDPRIGGAVFDTLVEMENFMCNGVDMITSDPVSAVQDLLAAGVKGVVNIIPSLIKGISSLHGEDAKSRALIAMVRYDKQAALSKICSEVGPHRFWKLVTGLVDSDGDFLWHVTPQMAGLKPVLANNLAKRLGGRAVDVMAFDQFPLLRQGWVMLCHLIRDSRMRLRY